MSKKKTEENGALKSVSYAKWGYLFILPFFIVYFIFTLVPQFMTLYNSFFEDYIDVEGLKQVGPNYVGLDNYKALFTPSYGGTIRIFDMIDLQLARKP